jgi:hypothetical protein
MSVVAHVVNNVNVPPVQGVRHGLAPMIVHSAENK